MPLIWTLLTAVFLNFCVNCCDGISEMPPPLPGTNTYQLRMPGAVPTQVSFTEIYKFTSL